MDVVCRFDVIAQCPKNPGREWFRSRLGEFDFDSITAGLRFESRAASVTRFRRGVSPELRLELWQVRAAKAVVEVLLWDSLRANPKCRRQGIVGKLRAESWELRVKVGGDSVTLGDWVVRVVHVIKRGLEQIHVWRRGRPMVVANGRSDFLDLPIVMPPLRWFVELKCLQRQ